MLPNLEQHTIVWFLIAEWLLAFIIVNRYDEHDQDGCGMIKVYSYQKTIDTSLRDYTKVYFLQVQNWGRIWNSFIRVILLELLLLL